MIATDLSAAQANTLRTVAANGGEMNSYAGQPGFYCKSVPVLVRLGLLDRIDPCTFCAANDDWANDGCERPLPGQRGGQRCYGRVHITGAAPSTEGSR